MVASGAEDAKVKIWSGADLELMATFDLNVATNDSKRISALAVLGHSLVAAARNGTVLYSLDTRSLDDAASSQRRRRKPLIFTGKKATWVCGGHCLAVRALAAHPKDARVFATTGDDERVILWRLNDAKARRVGNLHEKGTALCFSEDSLVVGLRSGALLFFYDPQRRDNSAWSPRSTKKHSDAAITALKSNGSILAAATANGDVLFYFRDEAGPRHVLRGQRGLAITAIDFVNEGTILRSVDADHSTTDWLLGNTTTKVAASIDPTLKDVVAKGQKNNLFAIAATTFDNDPRSLSVLRSLKAPRGRLNSIHANGILALAFLADDSHLISLGNSDTAIVLWKLVHHENPEASSFPPPPRPTTTTTHRRHDNNHNNSDWPF